MSDETDPVAGDPSDPATFPRLAERLLTRFALRAHDEVLRFVEVEVYAYADGHLDPFTHRHPAQMTRAGFYFHREGKSYRGGTFKGLDLTFGPEDVAGGILIRSLRTADGTIINGSCNCVEHLLRVTGRAGVADLDDGRAITDPGGPLQVIPVDPHDQPVVATARVGLTLARVARHPAMTTYFGAPYRFVTDPKVKKGKVQTVLALHRQGLDVDTIRRWASSTAVSVRRAIEAFERGRETASLEPWFGAKLPPAAWAEAYGAWVGLVNP